MDLFTGRLSSSILPFTGTSRLYRLAIARRFSFLPSFPRRKLAAQCKPLTFKAEEEKKQTNTRTFDLTMDGRHTGRGPSFSHAL